MKCHGSVLAQMYARLHPALPVDESAIAAFGRAVAAHQINHDSFPVIARKDGERLRLYSRPGNDPTDRSR